MDLGAKLKIWDLTAALSISDIMGTKINYTENSYENIYNGKFLGDVLIGDEYITPASVRIGFDYSPDLGAIAVVFDPSVSADYKFVVADSSDYENYLNSGSFWNNLSVGTEIGLIKLLNVRAGLNQGYLTMGLGLDILALHLNIAVYSFELGADVGERQQMGAVAEFAIAF